MIMNHASHDHDNDKLCIERHRSIYVNLKCILEWSTKFYEMNIHSCRATAFIPKSHVLIHSIVPAAPSTFEFRQHFKADSITEEIDDRRRWPYNFKRKEAYSKAAALTSIPYISSVNSVGLDLSLLCVCVVDGLVVNEICWIHSFNLIENVWSYFYACDSELSSSAVTRSSSLQIRIFRKT